MEKLNRDSRGEVGRRNTVSRGKARKRPFYRESHQRNHLPSKTKSHHGWCWNTNSYSWKKKDMSSAWNELSTKIWLLPISLREASKVWLEPERIAWRFDKRRSHKPIFKQRKCWITVWGPRSHHERQQKGEPKFGGQARWHSNLDQQIRRSWGNTRKAAESKERKERKRCLKTMNGVLYLLINIINNQRQWVRNKVRKQISNLSTWWLSSAEIPDWSRS